MTIVSTGILLENDLEALLLEMESSNGDTEAGQVEWNLNETTRRMNALSFGTGMFLGLITQVILETTMWDKPFLSNSTREIVLFSVGWSSLSCLIVHFTKSLYMRDIRASFCPQEWPNSAWKQVSDTMQGYVLAGALLSISGFWIVLDLCRISLPLCSSTVVIIATSAVALYIMFFCLAMPRANRGSSQVGCRILMASVLGMVIGFASQISLSLLFLKEFVQVKVVSQMILFSIAWSAFTVTLTFSGFLMLICCFKGDGTSTLDEQRTHLRMESFYVLCSLLGISSAWFTLDTVLGIANHIFPSLGMLLLSFIIFRTITYWFPEDKCLVEECETKEPNIAEKLDDK